MQKLVPTLILIVVLSLDLAGAYDHTATIETSGLSTRPDGKYSIVAGEEFTLNADWTENPSECRAKDNCCRWSKDYELWAEGEEVTDTLLTYEEGCHDIELKVYFEYDFSGDPCGKADTEITICVNEPPTTSLSLPSGGCQQYDDCRLDASGSSDPDGDGLTYTWESNKEDISSETGAQPDIRFKTSGTHRITVTVDDSNGHQEETWKELEVEEAPGSIMTLTSPSGGTYSRGSEITISAKSEAYDSSGALAATGMQYVRYLDAKSKPIDIGGSGGVYSTTYTLPYDMPLGSWTLQLKARDSNGDTPATKVGGKLKRNTEPGAQLTI